MLSGLSSIRMVLEREVKVNSREYPTWKAIQWQIRIRKITNTHHDSIKDSLFLLPFMQSHHFPLARSIKILTFCYTADFGLKKKKKKSRMVNIFQSSIKGFCGNWHLKAPGANSTWLISTTLVTSSGYHNSHSFLDWRIWTLEFWRGI